MKRVVVGLMVLMLLLGGCGKQDEIYFAFFFSDVFSGKTESSHLVLLNAISQYEEDHPNVKIHYTTGVVKEDYLDHVNDMILSGHSPDVMFLYAEDLERYVDLQALQSLDGFQPDMEQYYPCAVDSVTCQGSIYGLPFQISPMIMAVNMDILNQVGIREIPHEWTIDDLLEISRKIVDAGYMPICNYTMDHIKAALPNGNASGYDEFLQTVQAENYFTILNLMFDTNLVSEEDFKAGKVAFMPMKYPEYVLYHRPPYNIKNYVDFDLQCLTMPGDPEGEYCSTTEHTLLTMSRDAKNKNVAYDFMCCLSQELAVQKDTFRYSGGVSAVQGMTGKEEIREIYDTYLPENDIDKELRIIEYMLQNSKAK